MPGPTVPAPDAPIGTLLELVQLARFHCRGRLGCGSSSPRAACLRLIRSHPSLLLKATATQQQREFVRTAVDPWDALEHWIAQAIGHTPAELRRSGRERAA